MGGVKILNQILDIIYPPVCGFCGKLNKNSLCNKCKIRIEKNAIYKIEDYRETTSFFDEHLYLFPYDGEIREEILNYKFNEKSYLYRTFLEFIKNSEKICTQIKKYDIIMPIPISKKRMKQRGYNQSTLIAKGISKMFNIEYKEKVLVKIKDNKPQSELGQNERSINVQGAYKIKAQKQVFQKKILLIDDIFTTGNTANECAKALKKNMANNVGIFTIAKD